MGVAPFLTRYEACGKKVVKNSEKQKNKAVRFFL